MEKKFSFKLESLAAGVLFNRASVMYDGSIPPPEKGDDKHAHACKYFQKKAYSLEDGRLFFPSEWFRGCLILSQGQNACPINPAGASSKRVTLKTPFTTSIFFDDPLIPRVNGRDATVDDLEQFITTVVIKDSRIPNVRPTLNRWELTLSGLITDNLITLENFEKALSYAGAYIGIGDWRPAKGGKFGRFIIKS